MTLTLRAIPLLVALAPCVAIVAQMPAHATLLSAQYQLLEPVVIQRGDVVHLVSTTFSSPTFAVIHWRSDDGGRTWPIHEQLLTPPAVTTLLGDVDVAGDRVLVIHGDRTAGPLLLRSTDAGSTWSAPIPVAATVVPQTFPIGADLHVDGQLVVAAWTNDRATGRVFANRSTDGGLTWQPIDAQLDAGAVLPTGTIERVRCLGAGPIVHVLWQGTVAGGYATFHQRSLDGGLTWRPAPVLAANAATGRVVTDGPNVLLVASQSGPLRRSADYGDTWAPLTSIGVALGLDVGNDGSMFVATGVVGSWTSSPTYVVNVSSDGGQTWLATPTAWPGLPLQTPRVHFGGGFVWINFLQGTPFLGVLASPDLGQTWQAVGGPVNGGFGASERRTIHVGTLATPGGPRLYAYPGAGNSTLGVGTAGTGGVVPSLSTAGLPLQGRTTTFRVDSTVGGAVGLLGASTAPPAPWPLGNATVWLGGTPTVIAFTASGSTGAAGAGSYGLPCTVPIAPALVGASLTAQALVLDAGAPTGFAVTNAIELWFR